MPSNSPFHPLDISRLAQILDRIRSISVGVVGDFCLDAYWQLDDGEAGLSLETGKPTVTVERQRYSPGGAGNVVSNIASLGVRRFSAFGVLGNDLFGDELLRQLNTPRVDTGGLVHQEAGWQTSVYAKPYKGTEEQSRIDFGRSNSISPEAEQKLISALAEGISGLDALVINQQIPRSIFTARLVTTLNSLALQHPEKIFVLDSRHRIADFRSMICKLNAMEVAALSGKRVKRNEDVAIGELREYAGALFRQTQKPVFTTRSQLGLFFYDGNDSIEIPSAKTEDPIDPVGAGDTVVAAIASSLGAGTSLLESGVFAMVAASVTVRKLRQTGTATPLEMLNFARQSQENNGPTDRLVS